MQIEISRSGAKARKALPMVALAAAATIAATVQAQEYPTVSEQTFAKYVFASDAQGLPSGPRAYRWETDMILDFYASDGREYMQQLVKEVNERDLLGGVTVYLPPPGTVQGQDGRFDFAVGVSTDFFDLMLGSAGAPAMKAKAHQTGCFANPRIPGQQTTIKNGKIMAREDLKKERLNDCLLRGLLLNAGLMNADTLAFRDQPFSDADREEAFDVLQLLYHPSVRTGMSREETTAALKAEGLIQ